MAARKVDMQRKLIEQQRDRLLSEIEALKHKVAGLEMALSLLGSDDKQQEQRPEKHTRGGLRNTLLDLLREAGTTGLNAATAVETAQRRGLHLDKQSVSSTLSRMKADRVVDYDGDRYRLSQFADLSKAPNEPSKVAWN